MLTQSSFWCQGFVALVILSVQVSGECWIPGRCQGVLTNIVQSETKEECLQNCKSASDCTWFTFETSGGTCSQFNSCPTVDDSCSTCVSGESICENEGKSRFSFAH